jgi:hypothetical protein
MSDPREITFQTRVTVDANGRTRIPLPFDPDQVWGPRPRHHVNGSVAGRRLRAVVTPKGKQSEIVLGPSWCHDRPHDGDDVSVTLAAEGPQRAELDADIADALDADPVAAAFFDGLATFYRKQYLSWVGATKRSPQKRTERIAEMVKLLHDGQKERPR